MKRLIIGCRARIKSESWDEYNNHEALLVYKEQEEFAVIVLKEGTNVPLIKGPDTVIDQFGWLHPDELEFVDNNIETNMGFIDWCNENENRFCGDCGNFCGENII